VHFSFNWGDVLKTNQRAALASSMLGFAVVALDAQIANVALPAIQKNLGGDLTQLQWVVSGYTLMFSTLLLFGGTIADRLGSKAANRNGVILFVLASIACGLAPSMELLIFARFIQGIGAALVTPTSLSLIREAFDEPKARARAIGFWAVGGAVAAAAGPILGGLLAPIDWRFIFFVNLPVGIASLLVIRKVNVSPRKPAKFDIAGQITAVIGLGSFTFACIEGGKFGYTHPLILSLFVVAILVLTLFVKIQSKSSHPMLPLDLFKSRSISLALAVALVTMAAFYGLVFMQGLYFQEERGYSALITGLLFLPMAATTPFTNAYVAKISLRFGQHVPIVLGLSSMAIGLLSISMLPSEIPVWVIALCMILVGNGGAFTVPAIAALILEAAPVNLAGTASGVLNTFRQLGGSLGVAIFGSIANISAAFLSGLRTDYVVTATILLVAVLLTAKYLRKPVHNKN
jgi:DHA2 family methylenomycin A resistance protein-like MFS transporter